MDIEEIRKRVNDYQDIQSKPTEVSERIRIANALHSNAAGDVITLLSAIDKYEEALNKITDCANEEGREAKMIALSILD